MKKHTFKGGLVLICLTLYTAPLVVSASWWNPFSWSLFSQKPLVQVATTTDQRISQLEAEVASLKDNNKKPASFPVKAPTHTVPTQTVSVSNQTQPAQVQAAMTPAQYAQMMNTMVQNAEQNNPLVFERTLLVNALYGKGLSYSDVSKLDTATQQVISSGNKDQIKLLIKILNGKITDANLKVEQSAQTSINAYYASYGLPQSQAIPTQTNCTWVLGTLKCSSN